MKTLLTLIRLKKQQLDELRRKLAALETQKDQQQRKSAQLAEELEHELKLAETQAGMSGFFGSFASRIKQRRLDIAKEVARLDKLIDDAGVQIHTAFSELKKYELVKARREAEARAEAARKDTALMDEVAGTQHRRKRSKVKRQRSKEGQN